MPVETAPLLLLSELRRRLNTTIDTDKASSAQVTDANLRLRELIQSASEIFSELCNQRRFDRYYATRYYTPWSLENDGDLLSAYELLLDADLLEIDTITNGDDTSITTGYQLMPRNQNEKRTILLNRNGSVYWTAPGGTDDPVNSIEIAGTWGYGGAFESSGDTVQDDPLSSSATTVTVTASSNFEVGMMLKCESEYLYVTALATDTTLTVKRAYNGTTATAHVSGTVLSYYVAEQQVRQQVSRLVSGTLEQIKSPMFGTVVIADVSLPVTVDEVPNDVLKAAERLKYRMRIG
jgi:hypothetical protein